MAAITLDAHVAETLSSSVQSRIVQEGWAQDDDTALAEYIVLMIANGKTQSQILSELETELLPDAQGTDVFSRWLFDQVAQATGSAPTAPAQAITEDAAMAQAQPEEQPAEVSIPAAYETDMTEIPPDNAPKGPRGSQNSRGGRGGRGSQSKGPDAALHRVRGNDRINSHNIRGAPKGPRSSQNRPGMQKALNGLMGGAPGAPQGMANAMGGPGQNMQFSAEQQMQYLQMMEQQARIMAQWNEIQQGMNGSQQSRPLSDRIEPSRGRGGIRGRGRGGFQQNGSRNGSTAQSEAKPEGEGEGDSTMEGVDQGVPKSNDPATTMCHFNARCTNKECPYAHQSPAAPMNIPVDTSQLCTFGVTCKNVACTGRHPSPALKQAHQAESECRFWPNCTKLNCPFRHPTQKLCSFGASCTNANCKFTHLSTMCKFSPCTNARCAFKHAPGQNRSMSDYTWTPEIGKQREEQKLQGPEETQEQQEQDPEHVSDRKFVAEAGEEEFIKPTNDQAAQPVEAATAVMDETIT